MNREDLFEHPDYAQNGDRVRNRSRLVPLLQEEFLKSPVSSWVAQLDDGGVPCGPINELSDVFADPQVLSREMVVEIPHPSLGRVKQAGIPIKFAATQGSIDRHPPLLGEHTGEILSGMGYSKEDVSRLRGRGGRLRVSPPRVQLTPGICRRPLASGPPADYHLTEIRPAGGKRRYGPGP